MTQPAVTQRIRALERELGVQLLKRNSREVHLTSSGELLMPYASRLLQICDEAVRDLKLRTANGGGKLFISYVPHVELTLFASVIEDFRRRNPTVHIESTFAPTSTNVERVLAGSLDVAFVVGSTGMPDTIQYLPVSKSELVLVLPLGHPLAQLEVVPAGRLRGESLIVTPEPMNPTVVSSLEAWLLRHILTRPKVVSREPYDLAVESVSRTGSAMTIVPRQFATRITVPRVVYRPLSPSPLVQVGCIHRRDDPSPIVSSFLHVVEETLFRARREMPIKGEILG
jgi:DNA-binding transcriptional LysR family regulator